MDNWIYRHNANDSARFVLGEIGFNNLICIGINPSTATPENLDRTLTKVRRLAQENGFDGWLMLNVYPQRATNPNHIHNQIDINIHQENLTEIGNLINDLPTAHLWAAWGTLIRKRHYLINCLQEIVEAIGPEKRWLNLHSLTNNGHPRHPLYIPRNSEFNEFDINEYLANHG